MRNIGSLFQLSSRFLALTIVASGTLFSTAKANVLEDLVRGSRFDPREIQVQSIDYGGDGCPQGTVTTILSPDATTLTVLYDAFTARVGGGVGEERRSCNVTLRLKKPRLWSFSVDSVDFRGHIHLDHGVRAEQKVDFSSGPTRIGFNQSFGFQRWVGPISQNYMLSTVRPLQGPQILTCLPPRENTKIELKSSIRLAGGGGHRGGMMSVDSADGRLVQTYRLTWVSCLQALGELGRQPQSIRAGGVDIGGLIGGLLGR